jgi:hypothetical protein
VVVVEAVAEEVQIRRMKKRETIMDIRIVMTILTTIPATIPVMVQTMVTEVAGTEAMMLNVKMVVQHHPAVPKTEITAQAVLDLAMP